MVHLSLNRKIRPFAQPPPKGPPPAGSKTPPFRPAGVPEDVNQRMQNTPVLLAIELHSAPIIEIRTLIALSTIHFTEYQYCTNMGGRISHLTMQECFYSCHHPLG